MCEGDRNRNENRSKSVLSRRVFPILTDRYSQNPIGSHADLREVPTFTFEKLLHLMPK